MAQAADYTDLYSKFVIQLDLDFKTASLKSGSLGQDLQTMFLEYSDTFLRNAQKSKEQIELKAALVEEVRNSVRYVLHCTVLYYIVFYCTVLYSTILYCIAQYHIMLHCTVLHFTVPYCKDCTIVYNTHRTKHFYSDQHSTYHFTTPLSNSLSSFSFPSLLLLSYYHLSLSLSSHLFFSFLFFSFLLTPTASSFYITDDEKAPKRDGDNNNRIHLHLHHRCW